MRTRKRLFAFKSAEQLRNLFATGRGAYRLQLRSMMAARSSKRVRERHAWSVTASVPGATVRSRSWRVKSKARLVSRSSLSSHQRVHFATSDSRPTQGVQKVHFALSKCEPRHSERDSTHPKCAERSLCDFSMCTAPQRERFNPPTVRRGFTLRSPNVHHATARATRENGPIVRQGQRKRHSRKRLRAHSNQNTSKRRPLKRESQRICNANVNLDKTLRLRSKATSDILRATIPAQEREK